MDPRIANQHDYRILGPTSAQAPMTETRSGVIQQAWICSPWPAFGPSGFSEASKTHRFWPRLGPKGGAVAAAAVFAMTHPDRCLQRRDFLFSTPLHPVRQSGTDLALQMRSMAEESGIPVLCRGLIHRWRESGGLAAKARGILAISSRGVWLFDGARVALLERHSTLMNLSLARCAALLRLREPEAVEPWVWERLAEPRASISKRKFWVTLSQGIERWGVPMRLKEGL